MVVTLVQPDINGNYSYEDLKQFISQGASQRADLVVFPEYYPFIDSKSDAPPLSIALDKLAEISVECSSTFLAGGYALDNGQGRNFATLLDKGINKGVYFKQRRFRNEADSASDYHFVPGTNLVKMECASFSILPLICADAIEKLGMESDIFLRYLGNSGASVKCPVIVQGYSLKPTGKMWTNALQDIADGLKCPVFYCNYANIDEEGYGGGGSGLFLPGIPPQRTDDLPGTYSFDLA